MISQIFAVALLVASAKAGAISYISGGLESHGAAPALTLGSHGLGIGHLGIQSLGHAAPSLSLGHVAIAPVAHAEHTIVDQYAPAHYEFKYGVEDPHTGDKKQQSESRIGDTVKGEYSLAEPDGTIRVVKYTADPHNGFNAVVSRVGHAAHPQIVHKAVLSHGFDLHH